ncbi:MAG: glycosyltransferase family 2 protein [Hyphomicrobium sp.]
MELHLPRGLQAEWPERLEARFVGMNFEGVIRWMQSGWKIAGPRFPALLMHHLRLAALNRTSRSRPIATAPRTLPLSADEMERTDAAPASGDVVIPVYNNFDDTRQLLEMLSTEQSFDGAIIIVHDASTDDRLAPMLKAFAARDRRVKLLDNDVNLGFVQTCNRGLAASRSDSVILNTDIELPRGAVGRILRRLQAADDIATVTPFSNSAYGVGLPDLVYNNARPFGAAVSTIDACLQALGRTNDIALPSGNGFCMGIARSALNAIGAFDAYFGRGYGEETDFCMRAHKHGMRHVLASDVYVGHKGGQSFGGSWEHRSREGLLKVLDRHPKFVALVQCYLDRSEARAIALAAMLRLTEELSNKPVIIADDANASSDQAYHADEPRLHVNRQDAQIRATLTFKGESYAFRFADDDVFQQALRLSHAADR